MISEHRNKAIENIQEITNKVISDFASLPRRLQLSFTHSVLKMFFNFVFFVLSGPKREWFNRYIALGSRSVGCLAHGYRPNYFSIKKLN